MQFDEKWSFVGKKEKHCDPVNPDDLKQGDNWDHVALDPEHRLVVSVVPGKRTAENVETLVQDFKERTEGRPMNLITSDEYKPYRQAILKAYGEKVVPKRTGKPGRPKASHYKPSPDLRYATVHRGTAERDRPQPQWAEGSQDLLLLEGLGHPQRRHLLHVIHLQLLLACADAPAA